MANFFSKETLEKSVCSNEQLAIAMERGEKVVHEEFGLRQTSYVYNGAVFVAEITKINN